MLSVVNRIALFAVLSAGFIASTTSLSAFQPTRWSPMDQFILEGGAGGPSGLQVMNPTGKILSKAQFVYDGSGRLIEERFQNAGGTSSGKTLYKYKDGRIQEERLMNSAGKVLSYTKFIYKKEVLVGLERFDAQHKLINRQDFAYKEGRIIRGAEKTGAQMDQFFVTYREERPVELLVKNGEHGQLLRITYRYDEQGRLKQRVREAFGNISRCDYLYDANGRISAYAYYDRINGRWERVKKLEYRY